jgi:hypothetical protein
MTEQRLAIGIEEEFQTMDAAGNRDRSRRESRSHGIGLMPTARRLRTAKRPGLRSEVTFVSGWW